MPGSKTLSSDLKVAWTVPPVIGNLCNESKLSVAETDRQTDRQHCFVQSLKAGHNKPFNNHTRLIYSADVNARLLWFGRLF